MGHMDRENSCMTPILLISLIAIFAAVVAMLMAGAAQREAKRALVKALEEQARAEKDRAYLEQLLESVGSSLGQQAHQRKSLNGHSVASSSCSVSSNRTSDLSRA